MKARKAGPVNRQNPGSPVRTSIAIGLYRLPVAGGLPLMTIDEIASHEKDSRKWLRTWTWHVHLIAMCGVWNVAFFVWDYVRSYDLLMLAMLALFIVNAINFRTAWRWRRFWKHQYIFWSKHHAFIRGCNFENADKKGN
jgi:hypothetical protein